MSLLNTFDVGTTGLVAQSLRLNLIASNVANAETAVSADGQPYRARHAVFQAEPRNGHAGQGVKVLVVAPGSVRTNVSRNALNADGTVRGTSDAAIDNGIDPDVVATTIWDAVDAGKREIVIAEGMEAGIPVMRAQDPEKLFDMVEAMVADGYAQKIAAR